MFLFKERQRQGGEHRHHNPQDEVGVHRCLCQPAQRASAGPKERKKTCVLVCGIDGVVDPPRKGGTLHIPTPLACSYDMLERRDVAGTGAGAQGIAWCGSIGGQSCSTPKQSCLELSDGGGSSGIPLENDSRPEFESARANLYMKAVSWEVSTCMHSWSLQAKVFKEEARAMHDRVKSCIRACQCASLVPYSLQNTKNVVQKQKCLRIPSLLKRLQPIYRDLVGSGK